MSQVPFILQMLRLPLLAPCHAGSVSLKNRRCPKTLSFTKAHAPLLLLRFLECVAYYHNEKGAHWTMAQHVTSRIDMTSPVIKEICKNDERVTGVMSKCLMFFFMLLMFDYPRNYFFLVESQYLWLIRITLKYFSIWKISSYCYRWISLICSHWRGSLKFSQHSWWMLTMEKNVACAILLIIISLNRRVPKHLLHNLLLLVCCRRFQ